MQRTDGRQPDQTRPISFLADIAPHATGSVLVSFGNTRVVCAVTVERGVPRWMRDQNVPGGWLTAEYSMLPYSTGGGRKARDIARGKLDGRSSEIQRLIGRSLRAVVDLTKLDAHTAWIDCDVLQADGGTRTASITGASVACAVAFERMVLEGKLKANPLREHVAAISAGVVGDAPLLDLCYQEDHDARCDFNMVLTAGGDFVELQGSGESATFSAAELAAMLELGKTGARQIAGLQAEATAAALAGAREDAAAELAEMFGR